MGFRAVAFTASGLVFFAGGLLTAGKTHHRGPTDDADAEMSVAVMVGSAPVVSTTPERVRSVAPDIVAQPRLDPADLTRVEPRKALGGFGHPLPPPKPKYPGRILRPVIDAAGSLSGSGLTITLAGIEITPPERVCRDGSAPAWPCGKQARTAFRAFVRGRAVNCDVPEEPTRKSYTVACTVNGQDLGRWLVVQGWATALEDGPYVPFGTEARNAGKGMYGAAPSDGQSVDTAAGMPETPTGSSIGTETRITHQLAETSSPASAFAISARVSTMP